MGFYIYCISSNYGPNKNHVYSSFPRVYENFVKWNRDILTTKFQILF